MDALLEPGSVFDSALEERDVGDLQGMLFMFSVSPFPFALIVLFYFFQEKKIIELLLKLECNAKRFKPF